MIKRGWREKKFGGPPIGQLRPHYVPMNLRVVAQVSLDKRFLLMQTLDILVSRRRRRSTQFDPVRCAVVCLPLNSRFEPTKISQLN